jgi:DNA-binding beta-propeller fold protein YncE
MSRYFRGSKPSRRGRTSPQKARRQRLCLEALEDRAVPTASISIADATVKEQGNLGLFVPGNATVLEHPSGLAFGPDRNGDSVPDLYAVGRVSANIVVYDGITGAFVEQFVPAGSGFTDGGAWLKFGSNGDLFTSTRSATGSRDTILRIDQATKTVNTFISPNNPGGNGGLLIPKGMAFGPDGNFYVASYSTNQVLRYNGATGAFIDAFVAAGSGGLNGPAGVLFGPDRNNDSVNDLYVSSISTNQVLVYSGADGSFLGAFVTAGSGGLSGPQDMKFGPDGNLYVVSSGTSYEQVFRFNGSTGAFMDIPIATGSGIGPETTFIAFDGQGELYAGSEYANEVLHDSTGPLVSLSAASSRPVTVNFSTADGTAIQGTDYATASGTLTFAPGQTTERILVSPVDEGVNESNQVFNVNLANPVGATITQGQSAVTIQTTLTKFFVANDDSVQDRTYRYESSGAAIVSNWLTFADTSPRGIAANAAGTTYWVVDANKNIYVYSNEGLLQGSWSAGGLSSTATLTGIATNGTDIWLVDSNAAKVYKYTGAASRLSGSQNAASSFSLVKGKGGNTNPTDLVTDGTSFWIVDGSALKVFKYSLSGSSLGSWKIDPANTSPTGITINPNNVSDIWIVDNGTKKVYQYAAAASRTSGSQNAASSFALDPRDTNPQGIADPPVPGSIPVPVPTAPAAIAPPILAPAPAMQPSLLAPVPTGRDAFFALLGNAPSPGSVNQTAQRPAERNVATILPPRPEAAPILAARSDAVFAGSQQAADDVLIDMAIVADEDVAVAVE